MKKTKLRRDGNFYILKSKEPVPRYGNNFVYKYGATSASIKRRLYYANKKLKTKCEIIYSRKCLDVFKIECLFKWKIWDMLNCPSEFIVLSTSHNTADLIKIADGLNE